MADVGQESVLGAVGDAGRGERCGQIGGALRDDRLELRLLLGQLALDALALGDVLARRENALNRAVIALEEDVAPVDHPLLAGGVDDRLFVTHRQDRLRAHQAGEEGSGACLFGCRDKAAEPVGANQFTLSPAEDLASLAVDQRDPAVGVEHQQHDAGHIEVALRGVLFRLQFARAPGDLVRQGRLPALETVGHGVESGGQGGDFMIPGRQLRADASAQVAAGEPLRDFGQPPDRLRHMARGEDDDEQAESGEEQADEEQLPGALRNVVQGFVAVAAKDQLPSLAATELHEAVGGEHRLSVGTALDEAALDPQRGGRRSLRGVAGRRREAEAGQQALLLVEQRHRTGIPQ
jgi:hypothetical protein